MGDAAVAFTTAQPRGRRLAGAPLRAVSALSAPPAPAWRPVATPRHPRRTPCTRSGSGTYTSGSRGQLQGSSARNERTPPDRRPRPALDRNRVPPRGLDNDRCETNPRCRGNTSPRSRPRSKPLARASRLQAPSRRPCARRVARLFGAPRRARPATCSGPHTNGLAGRPTASCFVEVPRAARAGAVLRHRADRVPPR